MSDFKLLKPICSKEELVSFLPELLRLHSTLDFWEPNMSKERFLSTLLEKFDLGTKMFGLLENKRLSYFIALCTEVNPALLWLLYVDHSFRSNSKELLNELRSYAKAQGIKEVEFITSNLTRSYDRWVSKFGAERVAVTYKISL